MLLFKRGTKRKAVDIEVAFTSASLEGFRGIIVPAAFENTPAYNEEFFKTFSSGLKVGDLDRELGVLGMQEGDDDLDVIHTLTV